MGYRLILPGSTASTHPRLGDSPQLSPQLSPHKQSRLVFSESLVSITGIREALGERARSPKISFPVPVSPS